MLAVSLLIMLGAAAAVQTVNEYKEKLNLVPQGPNTIATSHDQQAVMDTCQEALQRLATSWHSPNTRMSKLAKPSYAFRLADSPPKPTLFALMDPTTAALHWKAMLERVMQGPWIDAAWQTHVATPWTFEHLCYKFVCMANGNIHPNAPALCLPLNTQDIPPAAGPLHTRHYLARHRDGYIMVNLGLDQDGSPLTIPLHTILAVAFHGPPQPIISADTDSDSGQPQPPPQPPLATKFQEVGHLCDNPWCIQHTHLAWCSHKENCNNQPPP
jgi:hypothetical protein